MKQNGKLPHELSRDDIMGASHYEGDTLANTVSAVFAAYKVDQFIWAHKRIETELVPVPCILTYDPIRRTYEDMAALKYKVELNESEHISKR